MVLFSFKHCTLCLVGGQVCSSVYAKCKNTSEGNDTCEVLQMEPLASNRGTQLHTKLYASVFSSHSNTAHLVFFDAHVRSSLDTRDKNTTIFNNIIYEVFQLYL